MKAIITVIGKDTVGILANLAISLLGYLLCGVIQTIVNKRKAKEMEG